MKYEAFEKMNKSEIEHYLDSTISDKKIEALVRMVIDIDDWEWVQEKLLCFIHDSDFWVAKNAISGFGDLARIHGKLDLMKVSAELKKVKREDLKGVIEDVFEDLKIFLKK